MISSIPSATGGIHFGNSVKAKRAERTAKMKAEAQEIAQSSPVSSGSAVDLRA